MANTDTGLIGILRIPELRHDREALEDWANENFGDSNWSMFSGGENTHHPTLGLEFNVIFFLGIYDSRLLDHPRVTWAALNGDWSLATKKPVLDT